MAPRGWEPRRFAQPESLAQLPPPNPARASRPARGGPRRKSCRARPSAASCPEQHAARRHPPQVTPPAKKAMRQNGRALYASRTDPNGPTRVEEDPDEGGARRARARAGRDGPGARGRAPRRAHVQRRSMRPRVRRRGDVERLRRPAAADREPRPPDRAFDGAGAK